MNATLGKILKQLGIATGNMTFQKFVILLLRVIVGVVFIYRGGMMLSDPMGVAMKVEEVLDGMGVGIFVPLAYIFAFVVSSLKLMIGVCLVLGASIGYAALYLICFQLLDMSVRLGSGMVSIKGLLSGISFILIGVLIIRWRRNNIRLYTKRTEWLISLYSFTYAMLLAGYCIYTLPILDRTAAREGDYLAGVFVEEGDRLGCGAETDRVMNCLPDTGYCFVLLSDNIANASTMNRNELNDLYDYSVRHKYPFICLIGSEATDIEIQEYVIESEGAEYEFKKLNKDIILSVSRSNPELLILKDGLVLRKFSAYKIPKLTNALENEQYGHASESRDEMTVVYCVIWFVIPLLGVLLYDYLVELAKYAYDRLVMKIGRKVKDAESGKDVVTSENESPASQGDFQ